MLAERAQQGVVGGDFVELTDGQDQTLHVRIDSAEEADRDGYEDLQPIELAVRIENRSTADSDGLTFALRCDNVDSVMIFGDTTLEASGQEVPAGSFVEGTMVVGRPDGCEGARIEASFFITYTGGDTSLTTGTWPLT